MKKTQICVRNTRQTLASMLVNAPNNTNILVEIYQTNLQIFMVMEMFYHVTFSVTLWICPGQMKHTVTLSKRVDFSGLNKISNKGLVVWVFKSCWCFFHLATIPSFTMLLFRTFNFLTFWITPYTLIVFHTKCEKLPDFEHMCCTYPVTAMQFN